MPSGRGRSRKRRASRPIERSGRDGVVEFEVGEGLDRHSVEALALEIRQLANRLGLEIRTLRVEATEAEPSG